MTIQAKRVNKIPCMSEEVHSCGIIASIHVYSEWNQQIHHKINIEPPHHLPI